MGVISWNDLFALPGLSAEGDEIVVDDIVLLGAVFEKHAVSQVVVSDVSLHGGTVGTVDGDRAIEGLLDRAVVEVLPSPVIGQEMPMEGVATNHSFLTHIEEMNVFDIGNSSRREAVMLTHDHDVTTEAVISGLIALHHDLAIQESGSCPDLVVPSLGRCDIALRSEGPAGVAVGQVAIEGDSLTIVGDILNIGDGANFGLFPTSPVLGVALRASAGNHDAVTNSPSDGRWDGDFVLIAVRSGRKLPEVGHKATVKRE